MTPPTPRPDPRKRSNAESAHQREVRLNAMRNAQRNARRTAQESNARGGGRGGSAGGPGRGAGRANARRRASLSLDSILETAIATLDREGSEKLTLRGLAAELDSGVASLYWYASGKDELMEVAADEVIGRSLRENQALDSAGSSSPRDFAEFPVPEPDPRTSQQTKDALLRIRRLILCLFAQMMKHPWLAGQLIKAGPDGRNAFLYWETAGQQIMRMELTPSEQFHASVAAINYATGMGAEISEGIKELAAEQDREAGAREQIREWEASDPDQYPFIHSVLGVVGLLDHRSEFIAGLDLLLSGLERQTWTGSGRSAG